MVDNTKLAHGNDTTLDNPGLWLRENILWLKENSGSEQIEKSIATKGFSVLPHSFKDSIFENLLRTGQSQRRKMIRERRSHRCTFDRLTATESIWRVQKRQWRDVIKARIDQSMESSDQEVGSRITCLICTNAKINVVTDCGHPFCRNCISSWLAISETCPCCRRFTKDIHPLHI